MLTVVDLFSGIGGFSLGLEATGGFRTIQFCEIDPYARRVLAHHWPEVPCHDDIRTMAGVPADVLCGGFPCQDISFAGQGAGLSGARSGLWFEMFRIITETRPRYVIIENVAALRSRGLDVVLGCLASIGYDAEWHCIPAAAVGAPHRRDRVWIIAYPHPERGESVERCDTDVLGGRANEAEQIGLVGGGEHVAYASSERPGEARQLRCDESAQRSAGGCETVSDTDSTRLAQRQGQPGDDGPKLTAIKRADWWIVEPDVGRVVNGVPARVDRLRSLGNSIVPQIAELIGRAILKANAFPPPTCPRVAPDR